VDPVKGFVLDEPLKGFDAESEFTQGEGPFVREAARAEPAEVVFSGVFGAVDDAQVFAAAAFDAGLGEAALVAVDDVEGFDHHALTSGVGELLPPLDRFGFAFGVGEVDFYSPGGSEELRVRLAKLSEGVEVPCVGGEGVDVAFAGEDLERCEA
jgi:hypothetical protein